ncbi:dnaJ homolog subfamily C member 28 [Rhinophrynus dorsalis]
MKLLSVLLAQKSRCSFYTLTIPCIFSWPQISHVRIYSTYKYRRDIKNCYRLLNVSEGCSAEEVRNSYRDLAKKYHPDSGSVTADANIFMQIDEAYRALLTHLAKEVKKDDSLDQDENTSEYKVPQHRHYLSYEGVGYGTPSQRQRQYMQFRVDRATEQVLDFRKQKLERQSAENSMILKDVRQSKKVKITQAIERLVEDLIQESMAKGDFDNLSGKGKPLEKFSYCPHIDPMTHNLNRILIDNGYQPEWILLQKEIRETIEKLRNDILISRKKLGDPMTNTKRKQWDEICEQFTEDITKLNKRINDFNLVVPLLNRQMVHFNAAKEISRAEQTFVSFRETMQKREEDIKPDKRMDNKQPNLKENLIKWLKHLKKF